MPIHLRAEPGDYAEVCLLPGDPARARWLAEHYMDGVREVNAMRGLLGYTGTFAGTPVSVQATGMGGPSAAIVTEELIELGVQRLLRVGTCGALVPGIALGDLVLAQAAVPADGTTRQYVHGEPHAPTPDWDLQHGIVHAAKKLERALRVGLVATTDAFYDPDEERNRRWAARGVIAVEMEAATIFTVAALRRARAACLLTVTDQLADGRRARIGEPDLGAALESLAEIALHAVVSRPS